MEKVRLLERIRMLESNHKSISDQNDLIASIISHLHRILSTRRGTVPISNDYGMPSIDSSQGISFQEYLKELTSAIVEQINRFEPRLSNITVQQVSDKSELLRHKFTLRANLTSDISTDFECDLILSSESNVSIISKVG